jgi:surface carbohydrate biosynthesis protein
MSKKIIYLPIETIAREFDARMLITHQALSRDYSVITGPKDSILKAAEIIKEGVYFYKSHGAGNFPKEKTSGFKYITLDEEGLVFVDESEYIRNSKPHQLEHLDIVFTWGSYQQKLLINKNPGLKGKIFPVGNTRFDLLRPEFNILYKAKRKKIQKKWGKYVVLNTRFAPGNFSRLYGVTYVESRKHQYKVFIGRNPSKEEVEFIEREAKYYKELFDEYVKMLKVISAEFPELNFILRPHPSEDIINWKKALRSLENVFVIFEGTAIDWIKGALAIIHTGCTTGIEAWALKKPVISYNPNKEQGIEPPLPNKFGFNVEDIGDLCKVLKSMLKKDSIDWSEEQLIIARSYITSIDGDYSFKRFLDVLDNLLEEKESGIERDIYSRLNSIENFKGSLKIRILKILSRYQPLIKKFGKIRIYNFIYDRFNKYPGLFAQYKKFPALRKKDISIRLKIYDQILNNGQLQDYSIKKIATDTFFIFKK